MSLARSPAVFFGLLILVRGLGQSALSTISISMVGKWFGRRLGIAMGAYSVILTLLFGVAFGVIGSAVAHVGWSTSWMSVGAAILLIVAPMCALLVRSSPVGFPGSTQEFPSNARSLATDAADEVAGYTLGRAACTLRFWIFALATSLFGLAAAGLGLFGESILAELGFSQQTFVTLLAVSTLIALAGQFGCGWAMRKWLPARLLAVAMLLYGGTLLALPWITSLTQLYAYAAVNGFAGGMIMVSFFAIWADAFGRTHLGRIQGAAQMLTVLSSAIGPLLFEVCRAETGSYAVAFYSLAVPVLLLALIAWFLKPADVTRQIA